MGRRYSSWSPYDVILSKIIAMLVSVCYRRQTEVDSRKNSLNRVRNVWSFKPLPLIFCEFALVVTWSLSTLANKMKHNNSSKISTIQFNSNFIMLFQCFKKHFSCNMDKSCHATTLQHPWFCKRYAPRLKQVKLHISLQNNQNKYPRLKIIKTSAKVDGIHNSELCVTGDNNQCSQSI